MCSIISNCLCHTIHTITCGRNKGYFKFIFGVAIQEANTASLFEVCFLQHRQQSGRYQLHQIIKHASNYCITIYWRANLNAQHNCSH